MDIWFLFALASVFSLATSETAQKLALTREDDISAAANNFVVWLVQATMAIPIALILADSFVLPNTPLLWGKLLLLGIIYFAGGMFYYHSFKAQDISISSILASISVVVSTSIGILFLQEIVSVTKIIGLLLVLSAIVIIHAKKNMSLSQPHVYALIGGALFGIAFSIDKSFVQTVNPHVYMSLFSYVSGFSGLLLAPRLIAKDLPRIQKNTFKVMLLSATGSLLFNTFTFLSYANGGEVGRVDAINNTFIFIIILLEVFVFKKRTNLPKKIFAASLAALGVFLLGTA